MGSEAYPFVEPEVKPKKPRKIEPQTFNKDEMSDIARIIKRGNGLEYNESAFPLLKKMQKAGLINLKGKGKVFISKEADEAGIGGSFFSTFPGSSDMIKLEAFLKQEKPQLDLKEDPDADIPFNIERKQTSTPAFKKWFGDSKVVDEDGKPLVVYHGTLRDFAEFSPKAKKATTGGEKLKGTGAMFFTPSTELASAYSGVAKSVLSDEFFEYPKGSSGFWAENPYDAYVNHIGIKDNDVLGGLPEHPFNKSWLQKLLP
jgi:hypothetical protein